MRPAAAGMALRLLRLRVLGPLLAVCAAFAAVATSIAFSSAGDASAGPAPGAGTVTAADLRAADGLLAGLHFATSFLGVIALVLCAWAIASDHAAGTLRNILVRQPRRGRVLVGHALALAGVLTLAGLVAAAVSVGTAYAVAPGQGVDTGAWEPARALTGIPLAVAAMWGYGLLGLALATVTRSPSAAIGIGVAYLLPVETVLGSIGSVTDDVPPGRLLGALAGADPSVLQLGVLAAWLLLACGVARTLFVTRDITT